MSTSEDTPFWARVVEDIERTLSRQCILVTEMCLLGLYTCRPEKKVGNRFLDPALAVARRDKALLWKSAEGRWKSAMENWATAEGAPLRKEEQRGLCMEPIEALWLEVLTAFRTGDTGVGGKIAESHTRGPGRPSGPRSVAAIIN